MVEHGAELGARVSPKTVHLTADADRKDLPVSGAVVRFAISSGRAPLSGARTLTVTTTAAGRASPAV